MYCVYKISIDGVIRYIGFTQDIKQREKQHNYQCFTQMAKKELYNKVRKLHPEIKNMKLDLLRTFELKVEAKRYECLLILIDHFKKGELWQRVPRITDV